MRQLQTESEGGSGMDGKRDRAKNKIAGVREREDSTRKKEWIRGVVFPYDL